MISSIKKTGVITASKIAKAIAPGQGRRMAERVARWVLIRLKAVFKLKGIVEGSIILWPSAGEACLEQREWLKTGGDQILIKTLYTVVSPGTERAMYNGLHNTRWSYPIYPGCSGSGIVIETGSKVKEIRKNDIVALNMEHASVVLAEEEDLVSVPEGVDPMEASFIHLGVITMQGIRKAGSIFGRTVAVFGQGLLGQLTIQLLVAGGAYPIVSIARTGKRAEISHKSGASKIITLNLHSGLIENINADITIDVTGNPEAIKYAIKASKKGGTLVLLGSNRGVTKKIDLDYAIIERHISIVGAHINSVPTKNVYTDIKGWKREGENFLTLVKRGGLNLKHLLTDTLNPYEPELFYRKLSRQNNNIVGAIFDWELLERKDSFQKRPFFSLPREIIIKGLFEKERNEK